MRQGSRAVCCFRERIAGVDVSGFGGGCGDEGGRDGGGDWENCCTVAIGVGGDSKVSGGGMGASIATSGCHDRICRCESVRECCRNNSKPATPATAPMRQRRGRAIMIWPATAGDNKKAGRAPQDAAAIRTTDR